MTKITHLGKKLLKFFVISQLAHSFTLGFVEYHLQAEKQDLQLYLDVLRYLSIRKDGKTLLKLAHECNRIEQKKMRKVGKN